MPIPITANRIDIGKRVAGEKGQMPDEFVCNSQLIPGLNINKVQLSNHDIVISAFETETYIMRQKLLNLGPDILLNLSANPYDLIGNDRTWALSNFLLVQSGISFGPGSVQYSNPNNSAIAICGDDLYWGVIGAPNNDNDITAEGGWFGFGLSGFASSTLELALFPDNGNYADGDGTLTIYMIYTEFYS